MNEPRSRRDAIVAQLAGELDDLVQRVERLGPSLEESGRRIDDGTAALNAAIEQYRTSVGSLTTQVLKNIGEFAVRRTNEAAVRSVEEQQALLQASARQAFEVELAPRLQAFVEVLTRVTARVDGTGRFPWRAHVATAILSAGLTAAACFFLIRL